LTLVIAERYTPKGLLALPAPWGARLARHHERTMKTERRHDLQTNVLAAWLAKKLQQIRPYTSLIVGCALGVLAIALVWVGISSYFSGGEEQAWREVAQQTSPVYQRIQQAAATKEIDESRPSLQKRLNDEKDPERKRALQKEMDDLDQRARQAEQEVETRILDNLRRVARDYPKSPAGWRAGLHLARTALAEGSDLMFKDPKAGRERLDEAITWFKAVKEQTRDPLLTQAAQFGLARAYEARNVRDEQNKDLDDAKLAAAEYEALIKAGSIPYKADAEQRLAALQAKENRFADWFERTVSREEEGAAGQAKTPPAPSGKALSNGAAKAPPK
jgi:hypothetical protein